MRVLQLAPRVCWPLDTGAKLRTFHLARVLSQRAHVTLLAFTDPEQLISNLENTYDQLITVSRDRGYTSSKILRGGLGSTPLPVLNYTCDSMKQTLRRLFGEQDFDIVQVESIHLMAYLSIIRVARKQPLVICDWHNIESELMRRYAERETNILRRAYARRTSRLMSEFEKRALREFDAHISVSERDAEQLRKLNSDASIFVIENGVDVAYYSDDEIERAHAVWQSQPERNQPPTRNRIVFVGSMDYHANIDGVLSFAREVWPRLRARRPELIFTIVGRDPSSDVRALAPMPGVEITGPIEDVRPYYREALASVVPLKIGGGSRLKILEAMAASVPVISTTLGAEGLNVTDRENILLADTNQQFIEAIVSVIENAELRKELVGVARALVSEHYDWSKLGGKLFEILQRLLTN